MTQQVLEYISRTYGAEPEYLWQATPTNAALRNSRTGKWFAALIGNLPLNRFSVQTEERADILNLKCDPLLSFTLVDNERIFYGYHMNKEHWISVRLDGCVPIEELKTLIDMSYTLVDSKGRKPHKTP